MSHEDLRTDEDVEAPVAELEADDADDDEVEAHLFRAEPRSLKLD